MARPRSLIQPKMASCSNRAGRAASPAGGVPEEPCSPRRATKYGRTWDNGISDVREADPALRYLPQVELRKGDATRVVRIGGRVLSYHVLAPYPGWSVFRPEIEAALDAVFVKLQAPQVCRISFRYINLLRADGHHIHGVQDTNIALRVGGNVITESLAVTYNRSDPDHTVAVKVATPDFVTGAAPPGYSLLCDIDVFTKPNDLITDYASAMRWIQAAHTLEKTEFFSILPEAISRRLTVTPNKESHNV